KLVSGQLQRTLVRRLFDAPLPLSSPRGRRVLGHCQCMTVHRHRCGVRLARLDDFRSVGMRTPIGVATERAVAGMEGMRQRVSRCIQASQLDCRLSAEFIGDMDHLVLEAGWVAAKLKISVKETGVPPPVPVTNVTRFAKMDPTGTGEGAPKNVKV